MPVSGHITSSFGRRRHPILGYTRMHDGIDIGARYGSPIHAAADGTVAFAGRNGGYGKFGRVKHSGAITTGDRKSVVSGKSVSVRVGLGGRRLIKKKNKNN